MSITEITNTIIAAEVTHTRGVVTYSTPRGEKLTICSACECAMKTQGIWPSDDNGVEYCQVSFGQHEGACEIEIITQERAEA